MTAAINNMGNTRFSGPALLLRVEGLALFLSAVALYAYRQENGWVFLALLLAPDLAMVGYLINTRMGSLAYNLAHTYVFPLLLLAVGLIGVAPVIPPALIWLAHIGMDRTAGYGLKYASSFKDTHMTHI